MKILFSIYTFILIFLEIIELTPILAYNKLSSNYKFPKFSFVYFYYILAGGKAMKTFKMISFDLIHDDKKQHIPLTDGIIINQENSQKSWILELFISKDYQSTFEELRSIGEVFEVQVIISFPENEPAPFTVAVSDIREFEENISVLLKGTVKAQRKKYAERLLKTLLNENLSNEELFNRFEKGMRERPPLKEF